MKVAPRTEREGERLAALAEYGLMDSPSEATFDAIARLAADICATPTAVISLVGENRQWFKAACGFDGVRETPRAIALCAHALHEHDLLEIRDTTLDPRFHDSPFVVGKPYMRFYAGVPLVNPDGHALGVLCVIDQHPRELLPAQRDALRQLATVVLSLCEGARERQRALRALAMKEARYRAIVDDQTELLCRFRPDFGLTFANPAYARYFGGETTALTAGSRSHLDSIAETDRAAVRKQIECLSAGNPLNTREHRAVNACGEHRWLQWTDRALFDDDGNIVEVQSVGCDITDRKRAEEVLHAEKERIQVTLESIGDAVITTDGRGRVEYLNPAAEALTGWARDEARGQAVTAVFRTVNEQTREPVADPIGHCLGAGRAVGRADQTVLIGRHGQEYAVQDSAAPIRDRHGQVLGAVLVFSDVTEERRLSREISHQAAHDALTGLINRREFERRLQRVLDTARADRSQHALCYLDLDQFKVVNDTCGHAAGDQLLSQLAGRFRRHIRDRDTVARLGGDEFAVLLEHCNLDQAKRVADELRADVEEFCFVAGRRRFRIGVSIGVVPITAGAESIGALLQAADRACYAAKDGGRNRVHVYRGTEGDATHNTESLRRDGERKWLTRIQHALEDDGFELSSQRIVPIEPLGPTGLHCEILLRLGDGEGRMALPGAFMPAAERYDLAVRVDRWVIDHAFDWLADNPDIMDGLELCAINLCGRSLSEPSFAADILGQLQRMAIPGEKICFEISETAAFANLNHATRFINTLKASGCRFALDDFGSGLSSFAYLKDLPVDFLKIDGMFVKDMVHDPVGLAMVRSINEIGQLMGKKTIAEFVESQSTLDELRKLGVDYAQGFEVSRPQPVSELTSELGRKGIALVS